MTTPQHHPFRVRTITAFLKLPTDGSKWEEEVAAAGAFLKQAQVHLESLGYEVQTVRIATQPFPLFLDSQPAPSPDTSHSGAAATSATDLHQQQQQQQDSCATDCSAHPLVRNAQLLESLAVRHGIPLLALGGSSDPDHLRLIPHLIAATAATSCTFALPRRLELRLARRVAAAAMRVAALTGGMGNFRFGASSNVQPGVPYFPVAAAGPGLHRSFALGTESDALLHQAFTAAASQCSSSSNSAGTFAAAEQQLHQTLLQHWAPLEAAALAIEAAAAAAAAVTPASQAGVNPGPRPGGGSGFRYLGLDSSLAPGLDTPPLTASYEVLGCCGRFGGAGSLAVSAAITKVLKELPLRLTGYCGLMLAVCEDQGLAAAAAAGSITISQLLQYSAVCGCGLDTVPVPGPTGDEAADAVTTASMAALLCDVNTLAHRLSKPLACRLLPLPGKAPGDATGFSHPYMVNSRVMDLDA
ncbi:hypothetical protein COO60DRAFT_647935 [Scenedesmus sp. NREL 46B-D3]|nr:hypothetical protein COO60DRAFT_647935 [Scenedesmus sp. NREL 46B-D3]